MVLVVSAPHAFRAVLEVTAHVQPPGYDLYLWRKEEREVLQAAAVLVSSQQSVTFPQEHRGDGIRRGEGADAESAADAWQIEAVAEGEHVGVCRLQVLVSHTPLEAVELLRHDVRLRE